MLSVRWSPAHSSFGMSNKKQSLRKKVEPKRLHPGAVFENGATLEGGAVFSLPCKHPSSNGCSIDVWVLCSMDVSLDDGC